MHDILRRKRIPVSENGIVSSLTQRTHSEEEMRKQTSTRRALLYVQRPPPDVFLKLPDIELVVRI